MVLKNVTVFSYMRENFLTTLCDHPDYPLHGNLQEKVKCRNGIFIASYLTIKSTSYFQIRKLKTFPDDAATQLIWYATGRASLFRKRVKSVVFGPGVPTGKSAKTKHYGPLMESNLSDKGNMHTESQKELMARSYLEIVRNLFIFA
jgi:hypothetical protein